jgi:CitMHS family citrate-Mg2+:H+ or citrate-Ca2+:H+ symporter
VLVILGFGMVAVFMALIMTKRMTPVLALIVVPTIFGLFAGAGLGIGEMALDAIGGLAPTAALLMFAIIYFGVMIDVGLFDPVVRVILRVAGNDPVKVVVGTALLAAVISLDGDGSTTFIVTTSALLPIYLRLGLSPVVLTCIAGLANGVMNILPWGGPTARAAAALDLQASDVFVPMIPSMLAGIAVVFLFAWHLGILERRRIGGDIDADAVGGGAAGGSRPAGRAGGRGSRSGGPRGVVIADQRISTENIRTLVDDHDTAMADTALDPTRATLRPKLLWFNALLTVAVMVLLVMDILPLAYIFMAARTIETTPTMLGACATTRSA